MATKDKMINKNIKAVPLEPQNIGIDINDEFIDDILDGVLSDTVDLNTLDTFSSLSQSRESIYQVIDTMASDGRVSAILETFTEDSVETNDKGQIVWCESSNEDVNKYVSYLIDVLNIDKNIYEWMYSLLRYGDLYLRLYRESDYSEDKDPLFNKVKENKILNEDLLKEDVKVATHSVNDHYVHYVEMVSNPGEMFELTKFGKTRGFIQAPINIQNIVDQTVAMSSYLTYKLKQNDVTVYGATEFVHASLRNSNNLRSPEEIQIFKNDEDYENNRVSGVYQVKRGQSMLYNKFKDWRQLCLTENSILLDRVTKSAVTRVIQVNTSGMAKNKVPNYLARLKQKIEQKTSLSVDAGSISEYTNTGPVVNSIYVPTTDNGHGQITVQTVGGEYDPKQLTDLDHQETKFYGDFRVPKAYFNLTDDGAGFNGGTSLAILSSRYGKAIKQYQNIMCQMITDLINLYLIDSGFDNYINRFTIHMQTPVTQEEIDKRENLRNRTGVINDIMSQASNLELEEVDKLKLYKELLSTAVNDATVISIIQNRIDELEKKAKETDENKEEKSSISKPSKENAFKDFESSLNKGESSVEEPIEIENPVETIEEPQESTTSENDSYLPSPDELSLDLTSNN